MSCPTSFIGRSACKVDQKIAGPRQLSEILALPSPPFVPLAATRQRESQTESYTLDRLQFTSGPGEVVLGQRWSSLQDFRHGHFAFLGQRAFAGFEYGNDFHFLLDRYGLLLGAHQLEEFVQQVPVKIGEVGR